MRKVEVKKAISFNKPSAVPIMTENIAQETKAKYGKALEDLLLEYPNDFFVLVYAGLDPDESGRDEWGCVWASIEGQVGSQVVGHPLHDWELLRGYVFPDPNLPERFEKAKEQIEQGVDILNPIQANIMDTAEVGCAFGGKVCFAGVIDTQTTLRIGAPDDVKAEVMRCITTLGTKRGGYICTSATTILPDIPLENVRAMFQAAKEYKY